MERRLPGMARCHDQREMRPVSLTCRQYPAGQPGRQSLVARERYRARLSAVLDARSNDAGERLKQLQAWCQEAEASGIRALQEYSMRLKGYALVAR